MRYPLQKHCVMGGVMKIDFNNFASGDVLAGKRAYIVRQGAALQKTKRTVGWRREIRWKGKYEKRYEL